MIVPLLSTFMHVWTHDFDTSFPSGPTAIDDHRQSTEQKPKYPCEKCSSVFSRKGGLTYHQKYECGQPPRFKCGHCEYCGSHISNARRHVRKCHPKEDMVITDLGSQTQLQQPQRDSKVTRKDLFSA